MKRKIAILSLFSLYIIFVSGISGYALVTGKVPPIVGAISSGIFASPAQDAEQNKSLNPQDPPDLVINPGEISRSESITQENPSDDQFDPDAKIDNDTNPIDYSDRYSIPTVPMVVTTSSDGNGTSSQPADPDPTSQDPSISPLPPSSPDSSNPANSSVPGDFGSSGKTRSITGISLDQTEITLDKGDIADLLIATITPSNATGNKTITWSSANEEVATVNTSGQITATGAGKTEVVAHTSNGKTAVCKVTVLVPATSIQIDTESFQIDKGSSKTLTATISPNDATDREIAWATSNADVLSIDSNGKVTAEDVGTAVITASVANGKIASTCDVAVGISISKLNIDKSDLNLIKGTQELLTATIDPPDTTEDKTVEWSSVNPEIATVDANGNVQAVAGGTTTITAQAGSHVAECRVTVSVPVTGIALSANTLSMMKSTTETLTATITPEDATNKKVVWSSSDESIVSVDSTGKITTNNFGTATITATTEDGNFTAQCAVNVITPVTGISLDKSVINLIRGTSADLAATVEPENATNKNVNWTSSDESIASVDSSGKITGVGTGTALIRAITEDGGFTAICAVSVTPDTYTITANSVNGTVSGAGEYRVGSIVTLTATPNPHYHFINWTSSDGTAISANTTYVVNGLYADMSITANFAIDIHTLTLNAGTGGTVSGGGSYPYGTVVTLSATPSDSRYEFVSWSDGNTTASRSYTVTGNVSLTATFRLKGYNWTASLTVADTRNAKTTLTNSEAYTCMAKFGTQGGSGTGTAHAVYTFNTPMLLKAGSYLKAITGSYVPPTITILINGQAVTCNNYYDAGGDTHLATYRVPADVYVNTIEVMTVRETDDYTYTPFGNTALFITPLSEKTFLLNSTGTSQGQDCTDWYYFDTHVEKDDKYTYVNLYANKVYFRKSTGNYAYFHFADTKAIDHIAIGPASSFNTDVKLYVYDYTGNYKYATKSMNDSAASVTFTPSDIPVEWTHVTDIQINCDNGYEEITVPITLYYTDGTSLVLGKDTYHGKITGYWSY